MLQHLGFRFTGLACNAVSGNPQFLSQFPPLPPVKIHPADVEHTALFLAFPSPTPRIMISGK
jgi:hypothetical protein